MKRLVFLLLLSCSGCFHPVCLLGEHHIALDPLPITNARKIVEVPLDCGRRCDGNAARVAVVDVDGLLVNDNLTGPYSQGENPVELFREKLDAIERNPHICAVVVRINSPGGDVTSTDIMWRDLQAFRQRTKLPVVTCLMNVGAGGAYYLATASDAIVAHPTSVTGGIGVILNLYNLQDTMGMVSVVAQNIKAGRNIDMGTSTAPLTPEAKTMLQGMADAFHARFKQIVMQSRPAVDAGDGANFDGRVFLAGDAHERRLIDQVGYVDDAIATAAAMAQVQNPRVVLFRRCNSAGHSVHSRIANTPIHPSLFPMSVPGLDRSRLPLFLYMWQPEATLQKLSGK